VSAPQYDLCREVLRRLDAAGVLDRVILIGSWCLLAYREYFGRRAALPALRTRDMDFLVARRIPRAPRTDIPALLADLGFLAERRGQAGYIQLQHPELFIEFLIPERGRGVDGAIELPEFGLNAQPLRYLDFAAMNTVKLPVFGVSVTVPHPANFALHKILVAGRRRDLAKRARDIESARAVLAALTEAGDGASIKVALGSIPEGWRKTILKSAASAGIPGLAPSP
jgi:hypothetical protein